MDLAGRRVAVTGATGFLGSHIVEELVARGATVIGVVRTPSKGAWLLGDRVSFTAADLRDQASMRDAFAGVDAVVANAALAPGRAAVDPAALAEANVTGVENTLAAAAEAGVTRIVHISTVAVYRTRLNRLVTEGGELLDPSNPRFDLSHVTTNKHYSLSKAEAEIRAWSLAKQLGLQLTCLRPGPIYGPRDDKATARYAGWMRSRLRLAPTVRIPHVHARDVAVAVGGALANPSSSGHPYNTTGPSVSVHELLSTWKRLAGGGPVLIPVPVPAWVAFDDTAAERDLGFRARSIEDGLAGLVHSSTQERR